MKKKLLAIFITLMLICCVGVGTTMAFADGETKQALTLKSVNYSPNILGAYGAGVLIELDKDCGQYWTPITDTSKITMVDKEGTNVLVLAEYCGNSICINRTKPRVCEVGDVITVKAGFTWKDGSDNQYEIKEDVSYEYKTANSPWVLVQAHPNLDLAFAQENNADAIYAMAPGQWGVNNCYQMNFNTAYTFSQYQAAPTELIEVKNAYGETKVIHDFINVGSGYFILRFKNAQGAMDETTKHMVGDTITFKAGFCLVENETFKQDKKFIVTDVSQSSILTPYTEDLKGSGLDISISPNVTTIGVGESLQISYTVENGYGTPKFTSQDSAVATVNADGLVTAVAIGTTKITATMNGETKEFDLTVEAASEIDHIEIVNNYKVWLEKGKTLTLPADYLARPVFESGRKGGTFTLTLDDNWTKVGDIDNQTVGEQTLSTKVSYDSVDYPLNVKVEVYEVGDVEIKEVSIVEWFSYAIFIQFPNSTDNSANMTQGAAAERLLEIASYITYERKDGTEIPTTSCYVLNGGNIAIFPFGNVEWDKNNEEQYKEYYLVDDQITMRKGMPIIKWTGEKQPDDMFIPGTGMVITEGVLGQDLIYRYDGNVWGLYVEYEDITAKATDIQVAVGKSIDAGISKVPSNATTGTYTFTSSDTSIATCTSRGVIKGVKEGTCTITVEIDGGTAGKKTLTLNVTVVDEIVGLGFKQESISISKGKDLDLASIDAFLKYASGKEGEKVDLSKATIVGFDKDSEGEQNVVFSYEKDGKTYTGQIVVNVTTASGCGSSIAYSEVIVSVMALLSVCAVVLLRKKEN